MTGMEHTIEQAEAIVYGVFDDAPDEGLDSFDFAREIVRTLTEAGLLAPAPLRVGQAAAEATRRYGVRTERADEFKAFCAGAMWAVKRTEGDGRAEQ